MSYQVSDRASHALLKAHNLPSPQHPVNAASLTKVTNDLHRPDQRTCPYHVTPSQQPGMGRLTFLPLHNALPGFSSASLVAHQSSLLAPPSPLPLKWCDPLGFSQALFTEITNSNANSCRVGKISKCSHPALRGGLLQGVVGTVATQRPHTCLNNWDSH